MQIFAKSALVITVIQAMGSKFKIAHTEQLKNGIKIKDTFTIVKRFKKTKNAKPVILMGYYNTILQYGENRFIKKCKQVRGRWFNCC